MAVLPRLRRLIKRIIGPAPHSGVLRGVAAGPGGASLPGTGAARQAAVRDLLACPACLRPLTLQALPELGCQCGRRYPIRQGVPVVLEDPGQYVDRTDQTARTNPYSPKSLQVIRDNPRALILDFGAGRPSPEECFNNVLRLDFVHFSTCDVVSNTARLPFRDDTFDFVISESTFEHLRDPWASARELYRVLKRRGEVIVDTAFLQPLHGDPFHYFNMTVFGVETIFGNFQKVASGVEPYQSAGMTMNVLRNAFIDVVADEPSRRELRARFADLDFVRYDRFINAEKQKVMAAGVYFRGIK